jgi:hypothetical protein
MALTLIKENGTGRPDANTYALAADGDAYHDGHLYADAWAGAAAPTKEKALAMATRLVDGHFQFNGYKRLSTQALQWPRRECRDPDSGGGTVVGLLLGRGSYLDETKVPAAVEDATCELARELLKQDRTDDPDGEGLRSLQIDGALKLVFDSVDRQPAIPAIVQAMLGKFGIYVGRGSGLVKLVRG